MYPLIFQVAFVVCMPPSQDMSVDEAPERIAGTSPTGLDAAVVTGIVRPQRQGGHTPQAPMNSEEGGIYAGATGE